MYTIIQITDPKKVYTPATFAIDQSNNKKIYVKSAVLLPDFHQHIGMNMTRLKKHINNMIKNNFTITIEQTNKIKVYKEGEL